MEYDNTNKGTLGKNNNPKNEKSPEYSGRINIEGKMYWLNGWVKTNKTDGSKFFSLTVNPVEEKQEAKPKPKADTTIFNDLDSDLPF
jgi:hypothetical protein